MEPRPKLAPSNSPPLPPLPAGRPALCLPRGARRLYQRRRCIPAAWDRANPADAPRFARAPVDVLRQNAINQDLLNRYSAGRDAAAEMIETLERETTNARATDQSAQ